MHGESLGDEAAEEGALVEWVARAQGSGIVYCRTRKEVERVSDLLCDADVDADAYHAGRDESRRRKLQDEWTVGLTRVVVATIAFGVYETPPAPMGPHPHPMGPHPHPMGPHPHHPPRPHPHVMPPMGGPAHTLPLR